MQEGGGREDGTVGAHLSMVYFREEVCRKGGRSGTDGAHLLW